MTVLKEATLPPEVAAFWLVIRIAMLLGALSIAGVRAIAAPRIECRGALLTDPSVQYMLTNPEGTALLRVPDFRECRLVTSGAFTPRAAPWVTMPKSVAGYLPD